MGDAFKGLTIRIGADVHPLKSALDSVSKSAKNVQSQLTKMTKAISIDATNAHAMETRLSLSAQKMSLTARYAETLRLSMQQAAQTEVQFSRNGEKVRTTLANAVKEAQDLYSRQQLVRDEFRTTNSELERVYNSMARFKEASEGIKFSTALEQVRSLSHSMDSSQAAAREFRDILVSMSVTNGTELPLGLGTADSKKAVTSYLAMNKAIENLKESHKQLDAELKTFSAMEAYQKAEVELYSYEAKLKEAADEHVRFRMEMNAMHGSPGLARATSDVNMMNAALEKAENAYRSASESAESMAVDTEQAAELGIRKIVAYKTALTTTEEALKAVRNRITEIKNSDGFDAQAAQASDIYVALEKAKSGLSDVSIEFENAKAKADMFEREMKEASDINFIGPTRSVNAIEKDLEGARREANRLGEEFVEAGNKLKTAQMSVELREAEVVEGRLIAKTGKLKDEFSKLNVIGKVAGTLRTMGYGLYSTVTPAIIMMARYAINAAKEIDASYRNMRKTVNGTEEEFEHLKQAAIEFSTTHVTDAQTILEIEALGGQLGIAARNLEGFSEVVSSLEVATDITAEDMATYIGQLSNIMDDFDQSRPAEYQRQITSFSDALVRLGNNTAAQESKIMKVMMRIASLGNITGFTTPQLLAIADAVAATGQGAEAAGTAISRTFSNIEAAVGKGGEKLEAFARVAGMSAESFADAWNNSPIEAFTAFIEGLKKIDDAGGSVDNTLSKLGIGSVRQKQALEGLTTTLDVLHSALGMSQDAWDGLSTKFEDGSIEEAGDAAREASRKAEGFSGQLEIMTHQAELLGNALAEGTVPLLQIIGGFLSLATSAASAVPGSVMSFVSALMAIVAAVGPVTVATGALVNAFARIKDATVTARQVKSLGGISAAMASVGENADALKSKYMKAFSTMSALKVAGITAGVMAIGFAISFAIDKFKEYQKKTEDFRKATTGLTDAWRNLQTPKEILNIGVGNSETVVSNIIANLGRYRDAADSAIKKGTELYDSLTDRTSEATQTATLVQKYSDTIVELGNKADKSAAEIEILKHAVERYNELAGTNYKIDETTGAIDVQTESIQRNTEAVKLNAYARAYASVYEDALKASAAANAEYESQADKLAKVNAEMAQMEENGTALETVYQYVNGALVPVSQMSQKYQDLVKAQEELSKSVPELREVAKAEEELANNAELRMNEAYAAAEEPAKFAARTRYALGQYGDAWQAAKRPLEDFYEMAMKYADSPTSFAQALSAAGIAPEQFANITIDNFDRLYKIAGGDLEKLSDALVIFNGLDLEDKEVTVDSDGLVRVNDELLKIDEQGRIVFGEHVYKVQDGQLVDVQQLAEETAESFDNIDDEPITPEVDDTSLEETQQKVDETQASLDNLSGDHYLSLMLTGNAGTVLQQMLDNLRTLTSTGWTVGVNAIASLQSQNASGGVSPNIVSALPKNASGGALNGIVTRAMITNRGWVGEAGDEAILHMKNAGGAIIPLSNRQHVRPFARAVAAEIPNNTSTSSVTNIYIDGAQINARPEMEAEFYRCMQDLKRIAG